MKKINYTNEYISNFIQTKFGNINFKILENNGDDSTLVAVTCPICGNSTIKKFRTLKYTGLKCSNCSRTRLDKDFVFNEIKKLGYEVLSNDYENENTVIKIKCNDCGSIFNTTYKSIRNKKKGCKTCQYNKIRKNNEDFIKEVERKYDGRIIPLTKYSGIYNKVKFKCNVCGNIWENTPNAVLYSKVGCHNCSSGVSYPNKFMKNLLLFLGDKITSIKEEVPLKKISNEWVGKHKFDFIINDNIVIEMDGGFHKNYKDIDIKKDNFAKTLGFKVIRINSDYKGINNRFTTIKNNVISSELYDILELEKINDKEWETIDKKSSIWYAKDIYDFYVENNKPTFKEMSIIFGKHRDTISKIIKRYKND